MQDLYNQILERYVALAENELRATQQICNAQNLEKVARRLIDADITRAEAFDKVAAYEAAGRQLAKFLSATKG